jgi:hypothetical protein
MGATHWLCSGHRPERSAWLDSCARVLLTSARRRDLPPPAREAGPSWSRRVFRGEPHAHWPAVMTPRRVALRADDAAAPHRAAGGAAPSIEGARTYAGGTTRAAAGRFPRVRSESTPVKSVLASPTDSGRAHVDGSYCTCASARFISKKLGTRKFPLPLIVAGTVKAPGRGTATRRHQTVELKLKPARTQRAARCGRRPPSAWPRSARRSRPSRPRSSCLCGLATEWSSR